MCASPSCAPLIQRVGPLSNWKPLVDVSAISPHTLSGTNKPSDFSFLFFIFYAVSVQNLTRGSGCQKKAAFLFSSHKDFILHLLFIRHRLEEGQASSWSRRLKFFMCCTRAQDTQSVSHITHSPVFPFVSWNVEQTGMKTSIEQVIKLSSDWITQAVTKKGACCSVAGNINSFVPNVNVNRFNLNP